MTHIRVSDTSGRMGRPKLYPDKIVAPLPPGSKARIDAVLREGEDKTDFLREAVAKELRRREGRPATPSPKRPRAAEGSVPKSGSDSEA